MFPLSHAGMAQARRCSLESDGAQGQRSQVLYRDLPRPRGQRSLLGTGKSIIIELGLFRLSHGYQSGAHTRMWSWLTDEIETGERRDSRFAWNVNPLPDLAYMWRLRLRMQIAQR
jgi:hypothetical protein